MRAWVQDQAGFGLGYVEQLYTFGDRFRDPREDLENLRAVTVAYLALVKEAPLSGTANASWVPWYHFFPWEDWRDGSPDLLHKQIIPGLNGWVAQGHDQKCQNARRERVEIAFGLGGSTWDLVRVLERYELLYEANLIDEGLGAKHESSIPSLAMVLDHRRILATAMGRLRGKLSYRPMVFELLPSTFTLLQLQRVVEALSGVRIHKQNFRRLVDKAGLVERTGKFDHQTGGRPAALFSFRREVLRERASSGVGLPGLSHREG